MALSPQILQGIANPAIGDFGTGFRANVAARKTREQEEEFNTIASGIIENQIGSKFAKIAKISPTAAINLADSLGIPKNATGRLTNAAGLLTLTNKLLQGGADPKAVGALIGEQAIQLESNESGINTSLMQELSADLLSGDPQRIQAQTDAVNQLASSIAGPSEDVKEIRKEVRKSVGTQISALRKEEGIVTTNFNKIRGLAGQIRKGNRTSVAQALVALVKLGDPSSTVRDSEMVTALNSQSPLAAVTSVFSAGGVSQDIQDAVLRSIDPLNPTTVNVDDVLRTADQLVLGVVPSIQARFQDARTQADENLTKAGVKSIFSSRLQGRIEGLSSLVAPQEAGPLSQLPQGTIDNGNGTFTLPTGETVEPE